MNSIATPSQLAKRRQAIVEEITRLREELEDIEDSLDLLQARKRNLGKPTCTLDEVRKKLGLKS
jgi:predicted DNA-binding protein YlxM (UPF0122 family)